MYSRYNDTQYHTICYSITAVLHYSGTKVEVVKRPSLIPTESQDIDEDIYDDTVAITNDIDDEQAIYDDTIGIQSEL